jgi:hypothetical protein
MFSLGVPKFFSVTLEESNYSNQLGSGSANHLVLKNQQSSSLEMNLIDFEWLACQPLLPFLVQMLPTHLLYRSLLSQGFEDSLEVIEWIRGAQLQKMFDFDLWEKTQEFGVEDVSFDKIMSWLQAWLAIGNEFAAERFFELEEETICLILSKIFEIIPEGVSAVTDEIRENWWLTPDKRFFLKINDTSSDSFEILKPFVDCLYAADIKFAGSAFAHASMLVRQEVLESGLRWRLGRIADQGFVPAEEARRVLMPKKIFDLKKFIEESKEIQHKHAKVTEKFSKCNLFLEQKETQELNYSDSDFESIVKLLTSFEPEEGVKYMSAALGSEQVKSISGNSSVPPEQFYEDEDFINEVAEKIIVSTKNILLNLEFRTSKSQNSNLLIEKAIEVLSYEDKETFSFIKDSISYLANCVTSATERTLNFRAVTNSLLITRGAINLGLELCLKMPAEYGLDFESADEIKNAVNCLKNLGSNFLFHLGWNLLFKLELNLAQKIIKLDTENEKLKNKLSTNISIELNDKSKIYVTLDKLIQNLRFPDINKWLASNELLFSNEIFFTFKAIFSQVPMFPKTLQAASSNFVTKDVKPFENLSEVDKVFSFIENLSENLTHITAC